MCRERAGGGSVPATRFHCGPETALKTVYYVFKEKKELHSNPGSTGEEVMGTTSSLVKPGKIIRPPSLGYSYPLNTLGG